MAQCPNCGQHLRFLDWEPDCPHCGTNLNYFNANGKLLDEAEKAEIEHSHFQPKIDRAKAAFFGSPLAIARLILTFLPIGALFLPLCTLFTQNGEIQANAINDFNYIKSADIGAIMGNVFEGDLFSIAFLCLHLGVILIPVSLLLIFTARGKHSSPRLIIEYGFFFLLPLIAAVLFSSADLTVISDEVTGGKLAAGAYIYLALALAQFILNIYLAVKPIPIKYTECLIGGIKSSEYFEYVNNGLSQMEIRRKMLVELTKLQIEDEKKREQEA